MARKSEGRRLSFATPDTVHAQHRQACGVVGGSLGAVSAGGLELDGRQFAIGGMAMNLGAVQVLGDQGCAVAVQLPDLVRVHRSLRFACLAISERITSNDA